MSEPNFTLSTSDSKCSFKRGDWTLGEAWVLLSVIQNFNTLMQSLHIDILVPVATMKRGRHSRTTRKLR